MHRALSSLIVLLSIASAAAAADWAAWRGSDGTGISSEKAVPIKWSATENVRWKAPLPGLANSSPIVSKGRVFVTCATDEGRRRSLYCFDRQTGNELWVRTVDYPDVEPTHRTNPYCGSTPVADGERVIVWHNSAGLYAYDYDGAEMWNRDLGKFDHVWGYGSSPVVYGDLVLMNCGPGKRSFLTALDRRTGATVWQVDVPGGSDDENRPAGGGRSGAIGSWSTPLIVSVDGRDQMLVSMPEKVMSLEPTSGEVLWTIEGLGPLAYTSVVAADGLGVAMSGYSGPAIGFKLGGSGDVTESNRLWHHSKPNPQRIGSGILLDGHLFMVNEPGVAQCIDMQTGDEVWQARFPGGKAWGSLILAGDALYVTSQAGTTVVFKPSTEGLEILAENALGEPSNSTPAVSNGDIFIRTADHLYCIAGPASS